MIQATSRSQVLAGVQAFGPAPGGRKLMDWEQEAAESAMNTGLYVTWRSSTGGDCTRVGPSARCFCCHPYKEHAFTGRRAVYPSCTKCPCKAFAFIPQRPEEVGEWWLPRRKGFNVHTWRAKCKCGHGHDEHDPTTKRCRCGCASFFSAFLCLACDKSWEEHETMVESAQERAAAGRPVGDAFCPLADDPEIREMVFGEGAIQQTGFMQPNRLRPAQVSADRGEKAVRIMHAKSGGAIKDQEPVNRWGKVGQPPLVASAAPLTLKGTSTIVASTSRPPSGGAGREQQLPPSRSSRDGARAAGGGRRPDGESSILAVRPAVPGVRSGVALSSARRSTSAQSQRGRSEAPPATSSGFRPVYD